MKKWLKTTARPAAASAWNRVSRLRVITRRDPSRSAITDETATPTETTEESTALTVRPETMTSMEAQRRFLAMLMASAFAAEQMRRLSIAVIDDDNPMRQAVGQLATPHTADEINRILSANPSLLDEGHSATFLELFGGGTIVDGEYVPVNVERIREALHLPEGPRPNN